MWTSAFQFSVFCSPILLVICSSSECICCVMSWLKGVWEVCFRVSLCLMRPCISGVKLGLCDFLLPRGMCFLSAFWMIVLKSCTVVLMFAMRLLFSVSKCCSVSLVNSSQLALL